MILQARDRGLFTAITDCGAGGLSSRRRRDGREDRRDGRARQGAAEVRGAALQRDLDQRGAGADGAGACRRRSWTSCWSWRRRRRRGDGPRHVRHDRRELILHYQRRRKSADCRCTSCTTGIPMPTRKAVVVDAARRCRRRVRRARAAGDDAPDAVEGPSARALAHPNVASKDWIIRQYDHEVQGGASIKPLVGAAADRPVATRRCIRPELDSLQGRRDRLRDHPARATTPTDGGRGDRRGGAQRRRRRRRSGRRSRSSTTSAGRASTTSETLGALVRAARPAATWRWRTARRSSPARTA